MSVLQPRVVPGVLVFDDEMMVRDVATFTDAAPYLDCPGGGQALQALKGLRMAGGWSREVRSRLAGASSCTHLTELLNDFHLYPKLRGRVPDELLLLQLQRDIKFEITSSEQSSAAAIRLLSMSVVSR